MRRPAAAVPACSGPPCSGPSRTALPRRLLASAGLALAVAAAAGARPAAAPAAASGTPRLQVEIAAGEPTVGDRVAVELVLTVPARPAQAPRFPAWEKTWGEAEIVTVGDVETGEAETAAGGGRPGVVYRQRLTLAAFRPGRVALPPQQVVVPGDGEAGSLTLTTPDDLALEVRSVLPSPEEGAGAADGTVPVPPPQPARPPVALPVGARFWTTAGLLAAALAAVVALLLRRRRGAEESAGAAALPPFEELARHLAAARRESAADAGLTRVSLALRRYLGRRLGFPAAESTTSEIRRQLAGRRLPDGVARRCGELLAACDLVKFARRPASAGDVATWADAAAETAQRIEDHLRPAESAAESAGTGGAAAGAAREAA